MSVRSNRWARTCVAGGLFVALLLGVAVYLWEHADVAPVYQGNGLVIGDKTSYPPMPNFVVPPPAPIVFHLGHVGPVQKVQSSICIYRDNRIQRLITTTDGGIGLISCSPDGRYIAFIAGTHDIMPDGSSFTDLFVFDLKRKVLRNLTDDKHVQSGCSWRPDGSELVFQTLPLDIDSPAGVGKSDNAYLELIDIDGRNRRKLATGMVEPEYPSWSPDGTRISFLGRIVEEGSRVHPACQDLYVIGSDGSNMKRILHADGGLMLQQWSSDGRTICYSEAPDSAKWDRSEIWIVNADGTGKRRLADPGGMNLAATFSPDDEIVMFYHYDVGDDEADKWGATMDLYSVSLKDGKLVQYTVNAGQQCAFPAFLPTGRAR